MVGLIRVLICIFALTFSYDLIDIAFNINDFLGLLTIVLLFDVLLLPLLTFMYTEFFISILTVLHRVFNLELVVIEKSHYHSKIRKLILNLIKGKGVRRNEKEHNTANNSHNVNNDSHNRFRDIYKR